MWFEPLGWFIPLFSGTNQKIWSEPVKSGLNHAAGSNQFWLVQTTIAGLNQPKAIRTSGLDQTMMGWNGSVKCGLNQPNQGRTTDIWTILLFTL